MSDPTASQLVISTTAQPVTDVAANAVPARRASLNDLPAEVCKSIVELAHKQDAALRKIHSSYESTIPSLSLVNKRLRELALPYLITSIKPKQLSSPFLKYGKIPEALRAHVRCLDLGDALETDVLVAAQHLHLFPKIEELVLSFGAARTLHPYDEDAESDDSWPQEEVLEETLAREVFRANAGRITSLSFKYTHVLGEVGSGVRRALEAVTLPRSLRKLRISLRQPDRSLFFTYARDLQDILHDCDTLEDLVIKEDYVAQTIYPTSLLSNWISTMRLPALKSLRVPATDFTVIRLLHAWVPHVFDLCIDFVSPYTNLSNHLGINEVFLFANLKRLRLSGPLAIISVLKHFDMTALSILEVKIRTGADPVQDYCDFDPNQTLGELFLPPNLRFNLCTPYQMACSDADWTAYRKTCAARQVNLKLTRADILAPLNEEFLADSNLPQAKILSKRSATIRKVLKWADKHAQWLAELQDAVGLLDLSDAIRDVAHLRSGYRA
ncbi:hypothetical protein JCM10908_002141 [Rhodotorula pacifica]|uniref:uncharacterized protein n=1 Tax=Rhodotorula pacifica TaxID=1495444 RepID=UPI00316B0330